MSRVNVTFAAVLAAQYGQGWNEGQPNLSVIQQWSKAEVNARAIALFAERLDGVRSTNGTLRYSAIRILSGRTPDRDLRCVQSSLLRVFNNLTMNSCPGMAIRSIACSTSSSVSRVRGQR